jgi:hypothetical protein
VTASPHRLRIWSALAIGLLLPSAAAQEEPDYGAQLPGANPFGLPEKITDEHFAALRQHSPFVRTLDLSQSLIITGFAQIGGEPVATLFHLETKTSTMVSRNRPSPEGWMLVDVSGDPSDLETLTASITGGGGGEVFSVRYDKAPPPANGGNRAVGSGGAGNGTPGGGTGPHGGPDPRVLTPDQLSDARNGARNIREGFQADGYNNNETIPPEVVSKLSRLSVEQRESINVKMYEYRNRGLGMSERKEIYHRLLDEAAGRR